ncbi:XK-related protein 9 [Mastacembelus armatus]|uniref:XK-related protein n=1 Tax=Mastacembelus armatus TaxID=205130 RepID=A0A7N8XD81_9TELE|nr:XK-related protein 9 [Mastacembelus armatus]XP_026148170.1 XK-related protein 9 [Mastacembelus armatus]
MLDSGNQYTKLRWLLTTSGLVLYMVDFCTDIALVLKYFQEEQYVWGGLTLAFVLAPLVVTQIFSCAWYWDDTKDDLKNSQEKTSKMSKGRIVALHLFGLGIFTRYYHLLKTGFKVLWTTTNSYTVDERRDVHHSLFCMATDLSMLKLFEAFLDSVPQLLLQLYIVLCLDECTFMQYVSMVLSFFNIAWALVDYRRCLRRSLPHIREMPSGLPTAVYFLYKLFTITSRILSYSLLLILSTYSTITLTILWLLGTTWAHLLQTNFCSSKCLELLYRAVIGVILTFTFFNVKGQDTKVSMIIYYSFHFLINIMAPLLLVLLKPEMHTAMFWLIISGLIFGSSVLGLISLALYYIFLHPRGKCQAADEVDGLGKETKSTKRIRHFLQP